jgi:hypothetical protein
MYYARCFQVAKLGPFKTTHGWHGWTMDTSAKSQPNR